MKLLVLSGSRNMEGQTARAVNAICKGAEASGVMTETLFLAGMKLERCRQCEADGWGKCLEEGYCIIKDDFAGIVEKIKAADLVVFANPVYYHDLSESMKTFLDRYRRITAPWLKQPVAGIPAMALCYAGGSGNGTSACGAVLERVLQTCGFDVVNVFLARRQNLEVMLPLLEEIGTWLATRPTNGPPDPGPQTGTRKK